VFVDIILEDHRISGKILEGFIRRELDMIIWFGNKGKGMGKSGYKKIKPLKSEG